MNDQCHDCKIRKLCYLEEPEEDWTCDHYEPCEYDEEVATDINVGDKDAISRQVVKDMIKNHKSDFSTEKDYRTARACINAVPPAQLGTNLAEVGTDCISRQAAIKALDKRFDSIPMEQTTEILLLRRDLRELPPAQPEIIRCRECKFASGDSRICMKFDHSPIGELDFCAWAERRTDEE